MTTVDDELHTMVAELRRAGAAHVQVELVLRKLVPASPEDAQMVPGVAVGRKSALPFHANSPIK